MRPDYTRSSSRAEQAAHGRRRSAAAVRSAPAQPDGSATRRRVAVADSRRRRALAAADALAASIALVLVASVLGDDHLELAAVLLVPLTVIFAKAAGTYERDELLVRKGTLEEASSLFRVSTLCTLALWIAADVAVSGWLGRDQLLAFWALAFVLMLCLRAVVRGVARRVSPAESCVLVGDAASAEWVARRLEATPAANAHLIGRIAVAPPGGNGAGANELTVPVLGDLGSLGRIVERHAVDRVIVAPITSGGHLMAEVIRAVKTLGVKVSVLPRLLEVVGSSVEFDELNGATLLGVRRFGLTRSSELIKRTMDLVGASIGFVLLAPLLAMAAVAIKLDTPGPVFFRQRRMGKEDTEFEMVKFRTMVSGADQLKVELEARNEAEGGLFKIADDPRITRVGAFLRRTSLDELPQLLNVLRGDMSLVGPRPLIPEEDRYVTGWQRRRLTVRPGMTGLWQIFGSARIPLDEMVKIDYLYSANWSLWRDISILLRTLPVVIGRRGL